MAITFVNKGTWAAGTTSIAPGIPTGMADGGIMILQVHTANHAVTTPSGWNIVTNSPVSTGTAGAAGGTRLSCFWRWWQSGDAAPTVTVTGGTVSNGIIVGYAGVDQTIPFDANPVATTLATASTTLTMTGITTVTANALIHWAIARDQDLNTTTAVTNFTNANLTGITETHDQVVNTGVGGGIWTGRGFKATAGATGNTTITQTSSIAVGLTIALRPAVVANATTTGTTSSGTVGSVTPSQTVDTSITSTTTSGTVGDITVESIAPSVRPVRISTTLWQQDTLGTSGTPGAKSITVPSDAQAVVIHAHFGAGGGSNLSVSSNFAGTFTVLDHSGQNAGAIAHAEVTSTGAKTLTLSWSASLVEGPTVYISFIKNINTSDWVRATLNESTETGSGSISTSISSSADDLILVSEDNDGGTPPGISGCTSIASTGDTYTSPSRLQSVNSPDATSTALNGSANNYATMLAIAIKPTAVAIVQGVSQYEDTGSYSTSPISVTITGVAAGNTLVAFVGYSRDASVVTCSDGTAYTEIASGVADDPTEWKASRVFYLPNASSGDHTVSVTFNASTQFRRLRVIEVAGLATSNIEEASADTVMSHGTTTDEITSGASGSTTSANTFVLGLTQDTLNHYPGSGTLAAGTGYTLYGSDQILGIESKIVSAAGAQTATFTDTKTSRKTTHVVAFKVAGGEGPVTHATLTGNYSNTLINNIYPSQYVEVGTTGVSSIISIGSLSTSQSVSISVLGTSAAALVGNVTVQTVSALNISITGVSSTSSTSSIVPSQSVNRSLTGTTASSTISSIAPRIYKDISGISATASVSSITPSQITGITLVGVGASLVGGNESVSELVIIGVTGTLATYTAGSIAISQAVEEPVTGTTAVASVGTIGVSAVPIITLNITGNSTIVAIGTISTSQLVSTSIASTSSTASVGTISSSKVNTVSITGITAISSIASVTRNQVVNTSIAGNSSSSSVGFIAPNGSSVVSISITATNAVGSTSSFATSQTVARTIGGNTTQGTVGTVYRTANANITSTTISGSVGSISKEIRLAISGTQSTSTVSNIVTGQVYTVTLTGTISTSQIGSIQKALNVGLLGIPSLASVSSILTSLGIVLSGNTGNILQGSINAGPVKSVNISGIELQGIVGNIVPTVQLVNFAEIYEVANVSYVQLVDNVLVISVESSYNIVTTSKEDTFISILEDDSFIVSANNDHFISSDEIGDYYVAA